MLPKPRSRAFVALSPTSRSPGWPANCRSSTTPTRRITWKGFGARACDNCDLQRLARRYLKLNWTINHSALKVFAGRRGHGDAAIVGKHQGERHAVDRGSRYRERVQCRAEAPDDQ